MRDCAILVGDRGQYILAAGTIVDSEAKLKSKLVTFLSPHTLHFLGFNLEFPLGEGQRENERRGCGVRYWGMYFSRYPLGFPVLIYNL